jgi:hypothetical protein
MTKEEIQGFLDKIKPALVPPSGTLEITKLDGNKITLKVTGLPQDIFKVQGKIVKPEDEIKEKIAGKIKAVLPEAEITFT